MIRAAAHRSACLATLILFAHLFIQIVNSDLIFFPVRVSVNPPPETARTHPSQSLRLFSKLEKEGFNTLRLFTLFNCRLVIGSYEFGRGSYNQQISQSQNYQP
jgi:hypothetical protein